MRISLLALTLLGCASIPAQASVLIHVDQSRQHMTVAVDGEPTYDWIVSTGKPGNDTPNGDFRPNRMDADHHSDEYNQAPMPHAVFFDLHGHAIHGTFEKIGKPGASHGCVRLSPEHAATLFTLIQKQGMGNTRVEIEGDVKIALKASGKTNVARGDTRAPLPLHDEIDGTVDPNATAPSGYRSAPATTVARDDDYRRGGYEPTPYSGYDSQGFWRDNSSYQQPQPQPAPLFRWR